MTDEPKKSSTGTWIAVLVALGVVGAAGYFLWMRMQAAPPPAPGVEAPAVVDAGPPPAPVLSLAEGDALLRKLATALSGSKLLAEWMGQGDLIRRLSAAVNLVAEGHSPRTVIGFVHPLGGFEAVKRKKKLYPSPRSYARYDLITQAVASVDPGAVGQAYGQLKPYFDFAYAEIGKPGTTFDATLRRALDLLLGTPLPASDPELKPAKGLTFVYADPALESLSDAQKHLLRLGPANAKALQGWLKALEQALPK